MKNIYRKLYAVIMVLFMLVNLLACSNLNPDENVQQPDQNIETQSSTAENDTITPVPDNVVSEIIPTQSVNPSEEQNTPQEPTDTPIISTELKVHFIDVDQGDSILIESSGKFMLIDAGENDQGNKVVDYLNNAGVEKLDYVIATHPHSDHIGGLDTVINNFDIGKIIMPDVVHTTQTFEDFIDAIDNKGLKITKAIVGDIYTLGDASFIITSPTSASYEDLNNYSVGIKLSFGKNAFLFTGDAENISENEMLDTDIDLSANVLKLGHHGSSYSSSDAFLNAVNPQFAVISVGLGNQYGHPHSETLQKILDRNINLYRTDKQETIVFTSDGTHITVNMKPYEITDSDLENSSDSDGSSTSDKGGNSAVIVNPDDGGNNDIIVHITETGSKYHSDGCRYLSKSDISVTLEEALAMGYEPCSICDPPTE